MDPNRWAYRLAPQLTGRAQQAYAAMPAGEAGDYEALKVAILKCYDISEETYRQRFREATLKETETYRELAIRLTDTLTKWMKERSHSVEAVLEQVAIEQFMSKLPREVHIWVQEKKPDTVLQAGQLSDDYVGGMALAPVNRVSERVRDLNVHNRDHFKIV